MEGRLRREGHTWVGELHGYLVPIGKRGDSWCVWLMPGGEWTERCLRVGSLAEGAKVAREWIEKRATRDYGRRITIRPGPADGSSTFSAAVADVMYVVGKSA